MVYVFKMVAVSILSHAEFGPTHHREDALLYLTVKILPLDITLMKTFKSFLWSSISHGPLVSTSGFKWICPLKL